ncbi:MAG: ABC transporter ATP-binding protein [Magnetococcales bacterium]|nr:ABC transporter ATP-binding protein [Magnetococcales bacterium]
MTPLLQACDLTYAYPGNVVGLSNLNLTVHRGRCLAILGPNGSGKTTLLLHLNGTLKPKAGHVRLEGQTTGYTRGELSAWRRRVGLVLQDADDQLFASSVAEDVSFGPTNLGLSERDTEKRVQQALEALDIADLAQRPTHMLSFGQKKRVAIAGAVAMQPEILLLDEPTAGLDHQGSMHLLHVLGQLKAAGTTLVLATHDVDLAYEFADDVALFNAGRVLGQGDATPILGDAPLMATARLVPPFLYLMGQQLKAAGLLDETEPLPRTKADILRIIAGLRLWPT